MKDFRNTTWVVTGAGSGIGRLMSLGLSERGARVAVVDINKKAAEKTAREILDAGGKAAPFTADVSRPPLVKKLKAQITKKFGQVQGLINNAGIVRGGAFEEVPLRAHEETYAVNTLGVVTMTHAFLPDLIASKEGHLVNIASASGFVALPYGSTYASSKWAVIGFSDSIRLELKERGLGRVHVTTVCPSYIATGMFEGVKPPLLIPWLTPEGITQSIFRAIEDNRAFVKEPYLIRWIDLLKGIFPLAVYDTVSRWLGVSTSMLHWKGRSSR